MFKKPNRQFFIIVTILIVVFFSLAVSTSSQSLSTSDKSSTNVRTRDMGTVRGASDYFKGYLDGRLGVSKQLGSALLAQRNFTNYGDESAAYCEYNAKGKTYFFIERKGSQVIMIDTASSLAEIEQLLRDREQKEKKPELTK
ncbi:MAG: hypothetical protein PHX83_01375 [Acidobacteriia bacterium]|nr:hypothetical protein [Terriglobia bacterium]